MSEGSFCQIDGYNIWYQKVGSGNQKLLLIPNVLATCELEFPDQVTGFDSDSITLIMADPPGCGKSWPPDKRQPKDWNKFDAEVLLKLMNHLNIDRFSVLGYSDGGRTGLWMASKAPESIDKLVLASCNAFYTNTDKKQLMVMKDVKNWHFDVMKAYEKIYGKDKLQPMWAGFVEAVATTWVPKPVLAGVKCPTLILQGENDQLAPKQSSVFLKNNIKGAKVHVFKELTNNMHKENPKAFNGRVQEFVLGIE